MRHLGVEGYLRLTAGALEAADRMRAAVAEIDGIRVLGEGSYHLVAIASTRPPPTGRSTCSPSAMLCCVAAGSTTVRRPARLAALHRVQLETSP